MLGRQITNLYELDAAVVFKRAVICPRVRELSKPRPAAFVIHRSGVAILKFFNAGLYIYEKK